MTLQFVVQARDIQEGDQIALGPQLLSTVKEVGEWYGTFGMWLDTPRWVRDEFNDEYPRSPDVELEPDTLLVVYRAA